MLSALEVLLRQPRDMRNEERRKLFNYFAAISMGTAISRVIYTGRKYTRVCREATCENNPFEWSNIYINALLGLTHSGHCTAFPLHLVENLLQQLLPRADLHSDATKNDMFIMNVPQIFQDGRVRVPRDGVTVFTNEAANVFQTKYQNGVVTELVIGEMTVNPATLTPRFLEDRNYRIEHEYPEFREDLRLLRAWFARNVMKVVYLDRCPSMTEASLLETDPHFADQMRDSVEVASQLEGSLEHRVGVLVTLLVNVGIGEAQARAYADQLVAAVGEEARQESASKDGSEDRGSAAVAAVGETSAESASAASTGAVRPPAQPLAASLAEIASMGAAKSAKAARAAEQAAEEAAKEAAAKARAEAEETARQSLSQRPQSAKLAIQTKIHRRRARAGIESLIDLLNTLNTEAPPASESDRIELLKSKLEVLPVTFDMAPLRPLLLQFAHGANPQATLRGGAQRHVTELEDLLAEHVSGAEGGGDIVFTVGQVLDLMRFAQANATDPRVDEYEGLMRRGNIEFLPKISNYEELKEEVRLLSESAQGLTAELATTKDGDLRSRIEKAMDVVESELGARSTELTAHPETRRRNDLVLTPILHFGLAMFRIIRENTPRLYWRRYYGPLVGNDIQHMRKNINDVSRILYSQMTQDPARKGVMSVVPDKIIAEILGTGADFLGVELDVPVSDIEFPRRTTPPFQKPRDFTWNDATWRVVNQPAHIHGREVSVTWVSGRELEEFTPPFLMKLGEQEYIWIRQYDDAGEYLGYYFSLLTTPPAVVATRVLQDGTRVPLSGVIRSVSDDLQTMKVSTNDMIDRIAAVFNMITNYRYYKGKMGDTSQRSDMLHAIVLYSILSAPFSMLQMHFPEIRSRPPQTTILSLIIDAARKELDAFIVLLQNSLIRRLSDPACNLSLYCRKFIGEDNLSNDLSSRREAIELMKAIPEPQPTTVSVNAPYRIDDRLGRLFLERFEFPEVDELPPQEPAPEAKPTPQRQFKEFPKEVVAYNPITMKSGDTTERAVAPARRPPTKGVRTAASVAQAFAPNATEEGPQEEMSELKRSLADWKNRRRRVVKGTNARGADVPPSATDAPDSDQAAAAAAPKEPARPAISSNMFSMQAAKLRKTDTPVTGGARRRVRCEMIM